MTEYFEREIETSLIHALSHMPVVVITGLRQTGKSTLLLNSHGEKLTKSFPNHLSFGFSNH
jgi:predicted AAA+ superfamily ATPase